jgi:hypothetical protein
MRSNQWEALESRLHLSVSYANSPRPPRGIGNHEQDWPTVSAKPARSSSTDSSSSSGTTDNSSGVAPLTDPMPFYGTLNEISINTDTGEKPQSKLWENDGSWFGVFADDDGSWVWRLDGNSWTPLLQVSSSTSARADVFPDGNVTHILLYSGTSSTLRSVEYVPGNPGTYQLWSGRTTATSVSLDSGVETATIAMDGNGRLWIASDGSSDVRVRYSDAPYTSFSSAITIASGIGSDDISVITALPNGSVGVFWSDQNSERFGFRTHDAGANPASGWSAAEIPASQSAEDNMADDHMNVAVGSDGTMYVAVKTSYDDDDMPSIALLVRHPDGTWDDLYDLDNSGTRPIVVLNEREDTLRVFYTTSESGGNIVYRRASLSNMVFGSRITALTGTLNNVSSTRQAVTDDLVIVAADSGHDLQGRRFLQGVVGDSDYDLDVDLSDLSNLSANYGKAAGAWWSEGDFNGDGDIDLNDLSTMAANYGYNFA